MDPGEESFTLSSFDFNSSFGLYSSSDEGDDYANEQLDQRNKDDIDAYIELVLPPPPPPPSAPPQVVSAAAADDDDDKELELRISFSAVVPFPGFRTASINSTSIVSSKQSFATCEDANAQLAAAIDSSPQPQPVVESTVSCVRHRLTSNSSTVSIFPLAWTRFPPPVDDDYADDRLLSDINSWELVHSRKASPNTNSAANGGMITKLLVKLRSIIISSFGSMRASVAQAGVGSNQAQKTCPNRRRVAATKPFDRWLTLCKMSEPRQRMTAVRTKGGGGSSGETGTSSSKATEMKFEAMRKLFGSAVSPRRNNGSKSCSRLNKSCPTSIKSSPVHQSVDTAILVHAAIAHCKKSFGQCDDHFSF